MILNYYSLLLGKEFEVTQEEADGGDLVDYVLAVVLLFLLSKRSWLIMREERIRGIEKICKEFAPFTGISQFEVKAIADL